MNKNIGLIIEGLSTINEAKEAKFYFAAFYNNTNDNFAGYGFYLGSKYMTKSYLNWKKGKKVLIPIFKYDDKLKRLYEEIFRFVKKYQHLGQEGKLANFHFRHTGELLFKKYDGLELESIGDRGLKEFGTVFKNLFIDGLKDFN